MVRKTATKAKYSCLICCGEFIGLDSLKDHLGKYIDYSTCLPFPCSSCTCAFKTKEERNEHCRKEGHLNTYKTNDNPSKEMLLEHLLFDVEQARIVGVESLVNIKHDIFYRALKTLRCNGDKILACALCAEKIKDDDCLRNHIKQHIKYRMYLCKCKRTFYSEHAVAQHTLATGHTQDKARKNNDYCDMLVNHLILESKSIDSADVVIACKAEAMQELRQRVLQLPPKRMRNTQKERNRSSTGPSSDVEGRSQQSATDVNSHSIPASSSTTDNPTSVSRAEIVRPKPSSSNEKQRRHSVSKSDFSAPNSRSLVSLPSQDSTNMDTMDDRDEQMQPISSNTPNGRLSLLIQPQELELRTPLQLQIKCVSCQRMVPSFFLERQKHVAEKHMRREHNNDDYTELLEAAMKKAFPGQTYSSNQCQLCGGSRCSDPSSRREHVKKKHSEMLPPINCPACNQRYLDITELNKHWKNVHNAGLDIDSATKKLYYRRRNLYNTKLSEIVLKAYPEESTEGNRPVSLPAVEPSRTSFSQMLSRCSKMVEKGSTAFTRGRRHSDSSSDSGSEMEVVDTRSRARVDTLSSVAAQLDVQEESERIGTPPTSTVTCDDSSSDDDENVLEIAPPAIRLAPLPSSITRPCARQQPTSPLVHRCAAARSRQCTKRVLDQVFESQVYEVSSDESSSDEDDDIMILKECIGKDTTSISTPGTSSLGTATVTASAMKKLRLTSDAANNSNDSLQQNNSRWDQKERSSSGARSKSDAKIRRYIYGSS